MPQMSVLIVDDHSGFRAAARALLVSLGFTVVGESEGGGAAVEAAAQLRPDLVLLDVQLPDIDGFEVTRRLAASATAPAVVLVSTRAAVDYGSRIRASGALGLITKSRLSGDTLSALLRESTEVDQP